MYESKIRTDPVLKEMPLQRDAMRSVRSESLDSLGGAKCPFRPCLNILKQEISLANVFADQEVRH